MFTPWLVVSICIIMLLVFLVLVLADRNISARFAGLKMKDERDKARVELCEVVACFKRGGAANWMFEAKERGWHYLETMYELHSDEEK